MSKSIELMKAFLEADVPVLLWGPPGTGKTAAIQAAAEENDERLEVLIGAQTDPVEVGGHQALQGSAVFTIAPPWARRLHAALKQGRKARLFLDEFSCAPPTVQAALLRVVQDRHVADLDLRGVRFVAAANPADTAADGGSLAAATANRWAHLDWEVDTAAWVSGTLNNWGKPMSADHAKAAASVAAWISRNPAALLAVPEDPEKAGRAWPSPRSWSNAISALAYCQHKLPIAAACVGLSAAQEWAAWEAAGDLPDPEDILAGRAKLPTRDDRVRATLMSVVAAALAEHAHKEGRIARAWEVLASARADHALAPTKALKDATGDIPDSARALGQRILDARAKMEQ